MVIHDSSISAKFTGVFLLVLTEKNKIYTKIYLMGYLTNLLVIFKVSNYSSEISYGFNIKRL
jgi:hypothetical protein